MVRRISAAEHAYEAGKAAIEQGHWQDAISELENALKLNTNMAAAYPLLLQAALAIKDKILVTNVIERAAEHAPAALLAMAPILVSRPFPHERAPRQASLTPSDAAGTVYQLKITLKYSKPPIWRRVQVKSDITLADLHDVIQAVMGWYNCHLHNFETPDGLEYGVPDTELDADWGNPPMDESEATLYQILTAEKQHLRYTYDYGDNWEHDILLEKMLPVEEGVHYPRCLTGKRAAPPEDVGGIPGYENFLDAIADPQHEEHDMYVKWIGRDFDPQAFDVEKINAALVGYHSLFED